MGHCTSSVAMCLSAVVVSLGDSDLGGHEYDECSNADTLSDRFGAMLVASNLWYIRIMFEVHDEVVERSVVTPEEYVSECHLDSDLAASVVGLYLSVEQFVIFVFCLLGGVSPGCGSVW